MSPPDFLLQFRSQTKNCNRHALAVFVPSPLTG
jgi:hypothetical protein